MIRSSACPSWQPDRSGPAGEITRRRSYTTPRDAIKARMASVLFTKLRPPLLGDRLISRSRVFEPLTRSILEKQSRLTLITAAAGFGKTTLLAQWRENLIQNGAQVIWMSLDPGDNNPIRLLHHLQYGFQEKIYEGDGGTPPKLLDLPPETLMVDFANTLAQSDNAVTVFMLDDYHVLTNTKVHKIIESLINSSPDAVHYAIASRTVPPLRISHLKVRRLMRFVDSEALRFRQDDILELLRTGFISGFSPTELFSLNEDMEGWPIGLHLAALSGKTTDEIAQLRRISAITEQDLHGYIYESLFTRLSKEEQLFLLDISVLDEISPELCDAVRGKTNSEQLIQEIALKNLFLSPVGERGNWHRFHAVFLEFLRSLLKVQFPRRKKMLHLRASRWFEENHRMIDAAHHALVGEDYKRAAELVDKCGRQLLHEGYQQLFIAFVDGLPDQLRNRYANIIYLKAWAHICVGELDLGKKVADEATRLVHEERSHASSGIYSEAELDALEDELASMRLIIHLSEDGAYADISEARAVEEGCRSARSFSAGMAAYGRALIHLRRDEVQQALKALELAQDRLLRDGSLNGSNTVVYVKGHLLRDQGRLSDVVSLCKEVSAVARMIRDDETPALEPVHILLSQVCLEENKLLEAREHLDTAEKFNRQSLRSDWRILINLAKASLNLVQGQKETALREIEKAENLARDRKSLLPFSVQHLDVCIHKVDALLRMSRLSEAGKILSEIGAPIEAIGPGPGFKCRYPDWPMYIALAKYFLCSGLMQRAIRWLRALIVQVAGTGFEDKEIRLKILLAKALFKASDLPAAQRMLRDALIMGEERGYVRAFIDEGEELFPAIKTLHRDRLILPHDLPVRPSTHYLEKLLRAVGRDFGKDLGDLAKDGSSCEIKHSSVHLTPTEIEILELATVGLTTYDIARELGIKETTVKWHFRNLYSKLGVRTRLQAVAIAKSLELVSH